MRTYSWCNIQPASAAKMVAAVVGTRLSSNLRWHGRIGPAWLEAPLADGRTVRVARIIGGDALDNLLWQATIEVPDGTLVYWPCKVQT